MKHGSLFSGIGGFDLASEWMGWNNIFHCEINEFCRKILHYYWSDAISYEDIKTTNFSVHRGEIDILTGGFPCQPFSSAGKRKGTEDNRYLWGEMLRAISEIQPRFILGENVYGIVTWNDGMVFEQICADLENIGYEVQPFILPACSVNAPHRRDRTWFFAYAESARTGKNIGGLWSEFDRCGQGLQKRGISTDSNLHGCDKCLCDNEKHSSERGKYALNDFNEISINSKCFGWIKEHNDNGQFKKTQKKECREQQFSRADSTQSWWWNFPSQSPICSGDDGLPSELDGITFSKWRNESIKAYGNAVVPQLVYQIFKTIEEFDTILAE